MTSIRRCRSFCIMCRAPRMRRTTRRRSGSRRSATCICSTRAGTRCATRSSPIRSSLGVIPQDAKLTPWPDGLLPRWETLTDAEKKLYIRQADVYAAYLAYTDHEIGRVIQAVDDMGKLDNTLIIYISGDNGASAEGSPNGTPSEVLQFNGIELPVAEQMKLYDAWGSSSTYNHMAVPWAWAFDTPYKWTKQIPSFFGGTRQGMAISWPAHITDKGGIRWQFRHVVDIVPTILEVDRHSRAGPGRRYRAEADRRGEPGLHVRQGQCQCALAAHIQYFEMLGVQGLYNDGWMLSARAEAAAVEAAGKAIRIRRAPTNSSSMTSAMTGRNTPTSPRQNPRKGRGDEGFDVRRVRQISGAAARCLGGDAHGDAAPEPDRPAGRCSPTRASR